jgi:zinc metalloprotease ZmpA
VTLQIKKKGASYVLDDPTRDLRTLDAQGARGSKDKSVTSSDAQFGTGQLSSRASIAVDAHYGMARTWDYFATKHGRDGVDGQGAGLFARVHFGTRLANAYYDPHCACIDLGDGDAHAEGGAILPLASLDVVAHELTHAVTAASAGLYGSREAGGLNEATSDIFGAMVERFAKNANQPADWLVGAAVHPPKGLRNMAFPEKDGESSGCWSPEVAWHDPHASAGVANHFFYLLSEGSGSQTHTCGTKGAVHGIGADAAAAIWYRALTVYFTADTSFSDARAATLRAASDLHGSSSKQVKAVAAAWRASGVEE